jgi:hypothetical protein
VKAAKPIRAMLLLSSVVAQVCCGDGSSRGANATGLQDGGPDRLATLDRYTGAAVNKSAPWSSGKSVSIENRNGPVNVKVGTDVSNVVAMGKPFTWSDSESNAKSEMDSKLALNVGADGSGNVVAQGVKSGGTYPGWELFVWVPPGFNSALSVWAVNGPADVAGVDGAASATIKVDNGSLVATLGNGTVNATSGNGSVDVRVGGGGSGTVGTDRGSVDFDMPASAKANVQAQATSSVKVDSSLQSACPEVSGSTATAKTLTCNGGGGTYVVKTGNGSISVNGY